MSSNKVNVTGLSEAIEKELTLYADEAADVVKLSVRDVARATRKEIAANAPRGRTGKYAKSWRTKKVYESSTSASYVVYANEDGYRLAHLLEFGHAKRNGGRTRAFPHIKPAEERAAREIEAMTKARLGKL